jgi:hypothetical protein
MVVEGMAVDFQGTVAVDGGEDTSLPLGYHDRVSLRRLEPSPFDAGAAEIDLPDGALTAVAGRGKAHTVPPEAQVRPRSR